MVLLVLLAPVDLSVEIPTGTAQSTTVISLPPLLRVGVDRAVAGRYHTVFRLVVLGKPDREQQRALISQTIDAALRQGLADISAGGHAGARGTARVDRLNVTLI